MDFFTLGGWDIFNRKLMVSGGKINIIPQKYPGRGVLESRDADGRNNSWSYSGEYPEPKRKKNLGYFGLI